MLLVEAVRPYVLSDPMTMSSRKITSFELPYLASPPPNLSGILSLWIEYQRIAGWCAIQFAIEVVPVDKAIIGFAAFGSVSIMDAGGKQECHK